ncbi:hypothetical protein Aple_027730 [Acrocarpospora pleiomorpha]|uniref:Uncharacterized protein n=1 Tax=Acrocarpospora pleiomorpha TaxID=90975 RepID=A0A5M3XE31_9ACTN|nr:hypothetical protein Aple_027730 [Acrocarpospora pleiomorpha]
MTAVRVGTTAMAAPGGARGEAEGLGGGREKHKATTATAEASGARGKQKAGWENPGNSRRDGVGGNRMVIGR